MNPEPFDLASWIADKMGLNTAREYHKQRLEELLDAFDKAGFRIRELVESFDKEAIDAINSELPEGKKLKLGEIRALGFRSNH